MDIRKATKRDRKRAKRKYGMIVDGYSTREIPRIQINKREWEKKRKEKEERLNNE